jgi:hypothetical protein
LFAFDAFSLVTLNVLNGLAFGHYFWSCDNAIIALSKFKDKYRLRFGYLPTHVSNEVFLYLVAFNTLPDIGSFESRPVLDRL